MADEQALLEKPIEVKGLPDVIPEKTVDGFLGMIMTQTVRHATDVILKREVTAIADEMLKFRKVISKRMLEDESLDDAGPVRLGRLERSFEAGWRMWRTVWDNREEEAYKAFIGIMTAEEEDDEDDDEDDEEDVSVTGTNEVKDKDV